MPDGDVLACEFSLRPRGAPSLFDVAPGIRHISREPGAVVVEFDPGSAATVRDFTAAERLCCPTIGWDLEEGFPLRLRISAMPGQLGTLAEMFASARSIPGK